MLADVVLQRMWVAGMSPIAPGAAATAYVGRSAARGGGEPGEAAWRGAAAGCTYVVTGATSGIGLETARALARAGARVVLCCRRPARADALIAAWEAEQDAARAAGEYAPPLRCETLKMDLGEMESVRTAAATLCARDHAVDAVINNAGVFAMGAGRSETADGHESHLHTNCLAPFLFTLLLLPSLRRSTQPKGARVVNVASILHELAFDGDAMLADLQVAEETYTPLKAYAQSKLAEVMLTVELARRLPMEARVSVVSLHPGNVVTGVVRTLPKLVQSMYRCVMTKVLLSAADGARAQLHAASCSEPPCSGSHLGSDGCLCASNPLATDASLRARVWDACERLVGLAPGEADALVRATA